MKRKLKVLCLLVLCICFLCACGDSEKVKTAKYFDNSGEKVEALSAWTNVLREEDNNDYAYERYISLALELNRSNLITSLRDSSLERKAYFGQHKEKITKILEDFFLKNIHRERILSDSLVFVLENISSFKEDGLHFIITEARKRAEEMPLTRVNSAYIDDAFNLCKYFKHNADKEFAEIYFICGQREDCKDFVLYFHKAVALDSQYTPYLARAMFEKAQNMRNDEERLYLLGEVVRMSDKNLPYSQALLSEFKKLKKRKSVKEMRTLVKKYGQELSKKDREFLAPLPVWTEVPGSRTEVIGEGFGPGDQGNLHLPIKKLKKGDKYIIVSKHFQMKKYFGSVCKWVSYYGRKEQLCSWIPNGDPYAFRAEKGQKAVVFVLRLQ